MLRVLKLDIQPGQQQAEAGGHFVMRADVTLFTLFTPSKILSIKDGDKKPLVDSKDGHCRSFTIKG